MLYKSTKANEQNPLSLIISKHPEILGVMWPFSPIYRGGKMPLERGWFTPLYDLSDLSMTSVVEGRRLDDWATEGPPLPLVLLINVFNKINYSAAKNE